MILKLMLAKCHVEGLAASLDLNFISFFVLHKHSLTVTDCNFLNFLSEMFVNTKCCESAPLLSPGRCRLDLRSQRQEKCWEPLAWKVTYFPIKQSGLLLDRQLVVNTPSLNNHESLHSHAARRFTTNSRAHITNTTHKISCTMLRLS